MIPSKDTHLSQGDFSKAIEYHTKCLAMTKEVGDRAGEGSAYAALGNAYRSQGDFSKAIENYTQDLAIVKEVGDRAGEGKVYGRIGTGHLHLNDFDKAVAHFEAQHALATSPKLTHEQSASALNMGVTLTLRVRAARQGPATGADQAPGLHSHSSASAGCRIHCGVEVTESSTNKQHTLSFPLDPPLLKRDL